MKTMRQLKKNLAGIMTVLLALLMGVGFSAIPVSAAKGIVYTTKIHPTYTHPVTGVIEDSGGQASYATGQGMVEGCISSTGILEVTDSGEYYLTIRMGLIDYTSDQNFQVQNRGESGWKSLSMGVTGNGSDSTGTTADICIQVPSKDCILKGSMYVEPMGRTVIFYLYPSDFKEGNSTDMKATMVTESGGTATDGNSSANDAAGTDSNTADTNSTNKTDLNTVSAATPIPADIQVPDQVQVEQPIPAEKNKPDQGENRTVEQQPDSTNVTAAANAVSEAAATIQPPQVQSGSSVLTSARGLSLSTEGEAAGEKAATKKENTSAGSKSKNIVGIIIAAGLIIVFAAGGIYLIYKKRNQQGGKEHDRS